MAAVLSEHDQKYLNADQQKQVLALKEQYAAATDPNVKADLNKQAESIRAAAGYSGGKDGSGYTQTQPQQTAPQVNTSLGGQSAQDTEQWLKNYKNDNLNAYKGWINGYGVDANVRSMSNYIRQQMDKNSQDWHVADADTKKYLHDQNVELEKLLQKYAGGVESTYDPVTGRWSTKNSDLGYGWDSGMGTLKDYERYGITEDLYNQYKYDTSHYYNMTDRRNVPNPTADADGFSGRYAPYAYGTIQQYLARGTAGSGQPIHYDAVGDGYMDQYSLENHVTDANGNVIFLDDFIKPGVFASDYSQQFAPKIENGIIQASGLGSGRGGWVEGESRPVSRNTGGSGNYAAGSMGGSGNGGYSDMLEQMYGEALKAQLAQLESSYKQNVSDLDASSVKTDANYNEQKRQTDGTSAQNAANWREMANAYGLNSGTIGQAALAQNNQRQSDLNTLGAAQAQAQAEIERQRTLLGQQYQLQINQAIAENNQQKAQALYQEAVRMDEVLRQQQQNNANLMLQYAQMAMQQQQHNSDLALQYAKLAGSSGGGGGTKKDQVIMPNVGTDEWYRYLRDAAAASGQEVEDYLNQGQNYKTLGIQSGDRDTYLEKFNDWNDNWFNKGAGNLGEARSLAANFIANTGIRDGFDVATVLKDNGYSEDEVGAVLDSLGIK